MRIDISKVKRASPTILSCLAAAGVVGTCISAAYAGAKATKKLFQNKNYKINSEDDATEGSLSKKEKIRMVWTCYIPPVLIGTGTIFCIFSSNVLSMKQQKSLLGAYMMLEQSFRNYKDKLVDIYGPDAHDQIMQQITREKCDNSMPVYAPSFAGYSSLELDDTAVPEVVRTFYDPHSNRMFETTLSRVIQAEYHINRNFMLGGEVHVDEFYEFLGLKPLRTDVPVGWTMEDDCYWIDFNHHLTTLDDGMEVVEIEMIFEPIPIT